MNVPTRTAALYDEGESVAFYEARYRAGYMDEWPPEEIEKVVEVLWAAGLTETGTAVDFGCGTGFFTQVLADTLPGWRVLGTDVSAAAIEKARARRPGLEFALLDDPVWRGLAADFLFTHHVIEHVPDLARMRDTINGILKPAATMLHILPCGNEGSLAHTLSSSRKDGIQVEMQNRFFFEDEGHVRRLKSVELEALFAPLGFRAGQQYFTGQWWGMFDYFTGTEPDLIPTMTDPTAAVDAQAALRLRLIGAGLRLIAGARRLNAKVENRRAKSYLPVRTRLLLSTGSPVFALSRQAERFVRGRAASEWLGSKTNPAGDQMFVVFKRAALDSADDANDRLSQ